MMPSVTHIGNGAFFRCISLKTVSVPNGVNIIEHWAFFECVALQEFHSYSFTPPEAFNNSTFRGVPVNKCVLYVPSGSEKAYAIADGWKEFTKIVGIEVEVSNIIIENNPMTVYPNPAKNELYVKFFTNEETDYTIYSVTGTSVLMGRILNNGVINIEYLKSGIYFLKTKEGTVRFIKR